MGGAQGGIGGTTNYNGKELTGIIEAWKAGDLELARERQNFAGSYQCHLSLSWKTSLRGKRIMKSDSGCRFFRKEPDSVPEIHDRYEQKDPSGEPFLSVAECFEPDECFVLRPQKILI